MQAIGIDIGSSTVKGAILDLEGRTIGDVVQVPFPSGITGLPPLHFEVDPSAVVMQVETVARQLLRLAPSCSKLLCATQMGGLVLVDGGRTPRTSYVSWRDQRVLGGEGGKGSFFESLRSRLTEPLIRRLGNELRPGNPLTLLAWLADHRALPAGLLTAVGIGEYVLAKLCRAEPAFHVTQTAGMLDLTTRDWCYEATERLGLANIRWPKIVDLQHPIGEWNVDGTCLNCFAAVGDHPCALAGAGLERRELSINISTGSQVSVRTSDAQLGSDYQTRPYFNGEWLNTITHLPAGRSLNALVGLLTELAPIGYAESSEVWDRISRAVENVPETDLTMSLAFFSGPAGDRGRIENISLENFTAGHLFRAAMNNMADNYVKAAGVLAGTASWDRVLISGGLAQKLASLTRTIGDRLHLPFRVADGTEETLQGLLGLARDSMGR